MPETYEEQAAYYQRIAAKLHHSLDNLIAACDAGKQILRPGCAVGGQTIEANVRAMMINGVDAWAVEEARQTILDLYYDEDA
jgi:hypothetical protein